jgi:hypothetical protein
LCVASIVFALSGIFFTKPVLHEPALNVGNICIVCEVNSHNFDAELIELALPSAVQFITITQMAVLASMRLPSNRRLYLFWSGKQGFVQGNKAISADRLVARRYESRERCKQGMDITAPPLKFAR